MKRIIAAAAALMLLAACSKSGNIPEETDSFDITVVNAVADTAAEETDDIGDIATDGGYAGTTFAPETVDKYRDSTEDGLWELELFTDGSNIAEGEPFSAYAVLTYNGTDDITVYSSVECVCFNLEGDRYFGGGQGSAPVPAVSQEHHFGAGEAVHTDYRANGSWSADDPDADFYESFFDGSERVILPAGNYSLQAVTYMARDSEFRDRIVLVTEADITVRGADDKDGE